MRKQFTALIAAAGVFLSGPVGASEAPRPPRSALGMIRDLRLTVLARRALQRDSELAKLNLGVKVHDGVASLWGPIPSDETGEKAIASLMVVEGIIRVNTDFQLKIEKPALRLLEQPVTRTDTAKPLRRATAEARDRPDTLPPESVPPPPKLVSKEKAAAPHRPAPRRTIEPAAIKPVAKPGVTLAGAVEQVQQSDARFRLVEVRVRGTMVIVRPGEGGAEDAADLAQMLRKVKGVSEVVLENE